MMSPTDPLRAHLIRLLDWREAHAGFDAAVTGGGSYHVGQLVLVRRLLGIWP